jgi:Ca2+/H+ antiporter
VGAVLNATFGSIVEIILYIASLVEGKRQDVNCYDQLVKSALVGQSKYKIFLNEF